MTNILKTKFVCINNATKMVSIIFLFLLSAQGLNAQVSGYTAVRTTQTYASITSGTSYCANTACNGLAPSGITLPWNFNFNGTNYSTIFISENGFITFGTAATNANTTPISGTEGAGVISVWGFNNNATAASGGRSVVYKNNGTSFSIEWVRAGSGSNLLGTHLDAQITLYQTTNVIEFTYRGPGTYPVNSTLNAQVGLRGATNADFRNLTTVIAAPGYGTLNTSTASYTTSNYTSVNNSKITWTPPAFCTPPSTNASSFGYSNVVVNGTSSTADFSFVRGNGDGGVIAIAKAGSAPTPPSSGTTYTGASTIYGSGTAVGGGFLVYAATGSGSGTINVSLLGLTNGVTYYIAIYEYMNTGVCYASTSLSGNIPIPVCSPPSIQASGNSVSNVQINQADINWTGNGNGDDVIVFVKQGSAIITDPTQTTNYNANSVFGSGNQIVATGAYAVYKGTASSVTVTGLTTNITYYYAIYAHYTATNCYAVPPITGSFTTLNSPMTTSAQVVTQVSTATVTPSSINNQIIQLRMDCGTGTAPALIMNQLFFTTAAANGGTTNPADIANAKVYYTGTSSTFSTTTQFGSTIINPNGSFTVSGSTTLVPGSNYFWLTYDIISSPTIGNFIDAKLSTIDVGAILTPSGDPAGNRQIALTYCTPSPAFGGTACGAAGNIYNTSASLSGVTFYTGGTCGANPYTNLSSTVIANAVAGNSYTLTLTSAAASSAYYSVKYAWVDFNNNGLFTDAGENILAVNIPENGSLTVTGASFTPAASGNYRMRVALMGGGFGSIPAISPCAGQSLYYGEFKDFTLSVSASSTPMTYSSSTVTQVTNPTPPNTNNAQVVTLQVVTTGTLTPLTLSSLTFNTNGSTNITGDVTNARVFSTGINSTFSSSTQFGTTVVNPNGSYTVTGSITLSPGTNYFWVAYDVPNTATLGNSLDAEITSIIVGGNTFTPTITAPTGARPISLVYCVPSAGATGCSLGGDSWITAVSINGTGSTFNFTGGTCLTPYPNNYQINAYNGNVDQGGSYTITMSKGGPTYGARFIAWIDFNNNGVFTDVGEMVMDITQTAQTATGASFTVPITLLAGGHRMRTWVGYTGTIFPSDINSVITGCEVLNGANNQGEVRDFTVNVVVACTPPVISACPANISQCNTYIASWADPTATGTNPVVVCVPASGTTFAAGTTTVTCTATNACGSSSCSFDVAINESPIIGSCPANITTCNPVVTYSTPSSSGTPAATVICNPASGSTFPAGITTVTCIASNTCGNSSCTFDVTVNTSSTAASSIGSNAFNNEICLGNQITLNVTGGSLGDGADWYWYEGSCGSGSVIGTGTSISVIPLTAGIHTYYVRAQGLCNTTGCVSINILVTSAPLTISVVVPPINNLPAYACSGTIANNINVNNVNGATQYIWDAPPGSQFNNGLNTYTSPTPNANLVFGLPSGSGYYIGIQAANACGSTTRKSQWVRGTVGVPASVSGNTTACPNTSATYTCPAVTGATQYLWTITGNATVSGTGTSATVNFGAGWTGGTLCVAAQTPCYTSATKCVAISYTTVAPGTLNGNFVVCPGGTYTYSVAPVAGAVSYNWTLPAGATGSSTTNSISITYAIGFTTGNLCVTTTSVCGVVSAPRCRSVNSGIQPIPASISGPTTGLCQQTIVYSCPNQSGVTYTWTVPPGSTINSGQGTNAINVTLGTFSTSTICVSASNSCGSNGQRCISVKGSPNAPGAITSIPSSWCANESGIEFNVDITPLSGAYTLSWLYPGPSVAQFVLGGGNSTLLILNWLTGSGPVHVTASNPCGNATRTSTQANSCRESEEYDNIKISSSIVVYPNPANEWVSVEYISQANKSADLKFFDLRGREVLSKNFNFKEGSNKLNIDLSVFAKGVYILSIDDMKAKLIID